MFKLFQLGLYCTSTPAPVGTQAVDILLGTFLVGTSFQTEYIRVEFLAAGSNYKIRFVFCKSSYNWFWKAYNCHPNRFLFLMGSLNCHSRNLFLGYCSTAQKQGIEHGGRPPHSFPTCSVRPTIGQITNRFARSISPEQIQQVKKVKSCNLNHMLCYSQILMW